jgi:hypothetical protein
MKRLLFRLLGCLFLAITLYVVLLNDDYCVAPNLFYGERTPTIKLFFSYLDIKQKNIGYHRLIRGDILGFQIRGNHLMGYLSTKNFAEDDLFGLEGDHDKERYFILDLKSREISSGLSKSNFETRLRADMGIGSDQIVFRDRPEFHKRFWLSCE